MPVIKKIFLSSSFKDMHYERDYLISHAFLRLHADLQAANTGIFLKIVDLRGSSLLETSDVQDENIIRTCIDGIEDSKPWFVCLLGTRYGYKVDLSNPNASFLCALNRIMERYGFSEDDLNNKSATNIEVEYAFRELEKRHLLFFFRSLIVDGNLLPEIKNLYYSDLDCVSEMREDITNNMASYANNILNYTAHLDGTTGMVSHLENLDHMMYDRFSDLFAHEYGLVRNRNRKGFVKREEQIPSDSLSSSSRKTVTIPTSLTNQVVKASKRWNALIIEGEPGSGKSVLAKQLFQKWSKNNYTFLSTYSREQPYRIIDTVITEIASRMTKKYQREFLYLGESTYSPGVFKIQFNQNHKLECEREQDTRSTKLREHFEAMAQQKPIYLLIDDAHLVRELFDSEEFCWLFDGSIPSLKVIGFSCPGIFDDDLLTVIPFPKLTSQDAEKLVDFFTLSTGRRMDDSLRVNIVQKALDSNAPIQGIKMIVEYALSMTAMDYFDQTSVIDHNQWMLSQVAQLPFFPTEIWRKLYDRLIYLYGRPAKMILLRIAVTRFGLSQDTLEFIIQKHHLSTIDYYLIRSYLLETMHLLDENYVWRISSDTLVKAVLASATSEEVSEARADVFSFYEDDSTNDLEYLYQSCILHKVMSPKRLKYALASKIRNSLNFCRFLTQIVDKIDLYEWTIKNLSIMCSGSKHYDLFLLFRTVILSLDESLDIIQALDSRIDFLKRNLPSNQARFDHLFLLLELMLLRDQFPIGELERADWVMNLYVTARMICDSTLLIPTDYSMQIEVFLEVAYMHANDLANQGFLQKATRVLIHAIEKVETFYPAIIQEHVDNKNTVFYFGDSVIVPDGDQTMFRMGIKTSKLELFVAFIYWKQDRKRFDRYASYAIPAMSFLMNNLDKLPDDFFGVLETWIRIIVNLPERYHVIWGKIKVMMTSMLGCLDSKRDVVKSISNDFIDSICKAVGEHQNHLYNLELLQLFEMFMQSRALSSTIASAYEDCLRRHLVYLRKASSSDLMRFLEEKTTFFESILFHYKNIDVYHTFQQLRLHIFEDVPDNFRIPLVNHVTRVLSLLQNFESEPVMDEELAVLNIRETALFLLAISKENESQPLAEMLIERCDDIVRELTISTLDMLTALIHYQARKHQYLSRMNDQRNDSQILHLNELTSYVNLQDGFTENQLMEIMTGCDVLYRNAIQTKQWETACEVLFFQGDCLLAASTLTPTYACSFSGRSLKHRRVEQALNSYLNATKMAFKYDNLGFNLVDFHILKTIEASLSIPMIPSFQKIFQSIWKLQANTQS